MEPAKKQQLETIPTKKLTLGMYIVSLENSAFKLCKPGQLRSVSLLARIKKSDTKHVVIDWARSSYVRPTKTINTKATKQQSIMVGQHNKALISSRQVLSESKFLVRKVLTDIYQGKPIEVSSFTLLADQMLELVMQNNDTYRCLAAIRHKDTYLLEHSVNVGFLLATFGHHLGMDEAVLQQLTIGGLLHDVGKIQVDSKVLNKPSRLTEAEFELVKLHQQYADNILLDTTDLTEISRQVCLQHHEKLDGSGYPYQLAGEQISIYGRMANIVDIYDALTANRCYKSGMSPRAAFKILLSMTPDKLDQSLVYEFIRCIGVYPVGSLVQLSDFRVGVVWHHQEQTQLKPIVKCFFNAELQQLIPITFVDLIQEAELSIEQGISPNKIPFDAHLFLNR